MRLDLRKYHHYNIATAMRGPDNNSQAAVHTKMITTAVIRYFAGVNDYRPIVNSPDMAMKEYEKFSETEKNNIRDFVQGNWHFYHHFMSALGYFTKKANPVTRREAKEYQLWLNSVAKLYIY